MNRHVAVWSIASLPTSLWVLSWAGEQAQLSWLNRLLDAPLVVFFVGPALAFDALGLIDWNVLEPTGPKVLGSQALAEAIYCVTDSVVLLLLGYLVIAVIRLIQRPSTREV